MFWTEERGQGHLVVEWRIARKCWKRLEKNIRRECVGKMEGTVWGNEENEREEDRWWNKKCKEEARAAMQTMKSGNVVGSEYMYYFQKGEK